MTLSQTAVDFRHEVLNPDPPCARLGFCLTADLTGNGRQDVIVGGAGEGYPGKSLSDAARERNVPTFHQLRSLVGFAPLKDADELAYAMPTKVYEYMAIGLPAVVTGRGEIEQFVDESGGGAHVPNDPERIGHRLDGLLEDDRYRQQLARREQSHVERNFDRKTIARRFGDELSSLVEGGRTQSCGWP